MEETGGDEALVLVVAGLISLVALFYWYVRLTNFTALGTPPRQRAALYLTPLVCLALLVFVLLSFSAQEVREDWIYVVLFVAVGGTWWWLTIFFGKLMGISVEDDACEQRNPAAIVAICGAMVGSTLAFAGANIGEGPSIWNTIFCALIATGSFFALWLILELATRVSEAITIDRDVASGVRLAGVLIGASLILGRSVAGDWVSARGALLDLIQLGWPAAALMVLAAVVQLWLRPTPQNPSRSALLAGALFGTLYVALAVLYVVSLGSWEQHLEAGK